MPLDAFHSRDIQRVDEAIAMVDDLGCNIIRCWGGNVYESERFFNHCDEKGMLVWQDFAYACTVYPQTAEFLARVQAEVEAVVRRLRNHPSLALWCGDNEIDAGVCWQWALPRAQPPHPRGDPARAAAPGSLPPLRAQFTLYPTSLSG